MNSPTLITIKTMTKNLNIDEQFSTLFNKFDIDERFEN